MKKIITSALALAIAGSFAGTALAQQRSRDSQTRDAIDCRDPAMKMDQRCFGGGSDSGSDGSGSSSGSGGAGGGGSGAGAGGSGSGGGGSGGGGSGGGGGGGGGN